jgi:hypothetical protein
MNFSDFKNIFVHIKIFLSDEEKKNATQFEYSSQ